MANEEKLSKALEDFKTKYPSVTSADLQTFIIGWKEAEKNSFTLDVTPSLSETIKFVDWASDNAYKRCANGEWIQNGTGDYKMIARNTVELYNLYKQQA
jgi:hypothetical protein